MSTNTPALSGDGDATLRRGDRHSRFTLGDERSGRGLRRSERWDVSGGRDYQRRALAREPDRGLFAAEERVVWRSVIASGGTSELNMLVAAMASFQAGEGVSVMSPVLEQSHQLLVSVPAA
jgi:hypothetical protein